MRDRHRPHVDIADDAELDEVVALFEAGPYGDAVPVAIEAPFSIVLAGQQVIGRIDAVFATRTPEGPGFEVVDWKTGRQAGADPLQLSVYRLAWAELHSVPVEHVRAAFHYVRTGNTVEPPRLPGRDELEQLLSRG